MNPRERLRELAKKQLERAPPPVTRERAAAPYAHTAPARVRPMVVVEEDTFLNELIAPELEGEQARFLEAEMLQAIAACDLIGDDKVVPSYVKIPVKIDATLFGVEVRRVHSSEGPGFHDEPVLLDLEADLGKLSPTEFHYDRAWTESLANLAADAFGDILPVKLVNTYNYWHFTPTQHAVRLMGMENLFLSMYDCPDALKALMRFLIDDFKRLLRWEEQNHLIFPNGGNDYMGSGSYCFNRELPAEGCASTGTWGHLNSQETVSVSPEMFKRFFFEFYEELAREFGLVYYGCCEPVHALWTDCLEHLPGLRKISISPWCDEAVMARALQGRRVIYSRKPSPALLGVGAPLDEAARSASIQKTAELTRGLEVEYIFRDVYTLSGNPAKLARAVEIARACAEYRD